ncbi:MAG: TusE/DsrC/DsvC family sulfur relay protein [Gammaproteobacteria bacterium]|nr:TusE/DsrC/DsvC family sulfur relay protein [Gammaproteobacteria bacterium]
MYDTVNMIREPHFDRSAIAERAREIGIQLTSEHWEAITFINNFYDYHEGEVLKVSDYNKALQGKYSSKGGLKYLYSLFPQGPLNTISQLADISVNNVKDHSMGSVH